MLNGGAQFSPANPGSVVEVKEDLPVAARALGCLFSFGRHKAADDFDRVFAALNKQRPDGLYIPSGGAATIANKRIAVLALKSRLPSTYGSRNLVDAGGLMYYAADEAKSYRRAATYVDKILKGAKPADLPVQQPTQFELIINLKDSQADRTDDSAECAGAGR